jgi:hypothetical protein
VGIAQVFRANRHSTIANPPPLLPLPFSSRVALSLPFATASVDFFDEGQKIVESG